MALSDRLRNLDQRLLPGTRREDEDAESYLRRVAASRAISPAQAGDVMAALRVYFDVTPEHATSDDGAEDDGGEDHGGEDDGSEDGNEKNVDSD